MRVSIAQPCHDIAGSRYDVPIDFVAGSLGATASVYTGQPLDTLKVILTSNIEPLINILSPGQDANIPAAVSKSFHMLQTNIIKGGRSER